MSVRAVVLGLACVVAALTPTACGNSKQSAAASLPRPSAEILALSKRDRNLAVYDAFLTQL